MNSDAFLPCVNIPNLKYWEFYNTTCLSFYSFLGMKVENDFNMDLKTEVLQPLGQRMNATYTYLKVQHAGGVTKNFDPG